MEESTPKRTKNRIIWITGSVLLVLFLAGVVYVGGSLLSRQAAESSSNSFEIDFSAAKEIPQTEPEATGLVKKIDGNSLNIQEFNINEMLSTIGEGGVIMKEIKIEADDLENLEDLSIPVFGGADGPETEVVISRETKIYRDVTMDDFEPVMMQPGDPPPALPDKIELKIVPSRADQIGNKSYLNVWGERKGDRIVASVILFREGVSGEGVQIIGGP